MKKVSLKTRIVIDITVVIVLLLCVYALYQYIQIGSSEIVEPDISTKKLANKKLNELSSIMGLRFPKSTILLNIAEEKSLDIVISFKVQVSPAELEVWLKTQPFKKVHWKDPKNYTEHYFSPDSNLDWWNVSAIQNWKTGDFRLQPKFRGCRVLIDYDRPDAVIIYFVFNLTR